MKVHRNEGVAIHIGPEPCAGVREGVGEASAGERAGQPLSHERIADPGCRRCPRSGRQHRWRRVIASASAIRRGRRPWHARTLLAREPGDLRLGRLRSLPTGPHREGEEPKPMMHEPEKSDLLHSSDEAGEQSSGHRVRSWWSQGRGPRETRTSLTCPGRRAGPACPRGLDRVRQAARQGRRRRFTALLHHVTVDLLREAYFRAQAGRGTRGGWT